MEILMAPKVKVKASPEPQIPVKPVQQTPAANAQPASNATRQLEKRQVHQKASADQSILQEKGSDALPVSDYPLKAGPTAANTLDQRERARTRTRSGSSS